MFRQPTFAQLQVRANDNHGSSGIINPLTEQILAEAPLFAAQRIGQRFQGTAVPTQNLRSVPTIIKEGINRLLEHPLFIADNDIRRMQFQQPFKPVIPVDDTLIEIIKV